MLRSLTLELLATASSTSIRSLWRIADGAEAMYRFGILSFDEGKDREIADPNWRLKRIQRAITRTIRNSVPVGPYVCSVTGRGALWGASRHLGHPLLSRRDLASAFPSTTCAMVQEALASQRMPADAATLVRRLVTVRGSLPQGAPSSNVMLDLVLAPLDEALARLSDEHDATYTRFADDLTFSSSTTLHAMMMRVDALVPGCGYAINSSKSRDFGAADQKLMNGIVVGTTLSLPVAFLTDTEQLIAEALKGNWTLSRRQILGRVEWISKFHRDQGEELRKRLKAISNQGGRFRAIRRSVLRFRQTDNRGTRKPS